MMLRKLITTVVENTFLPNADNIKYPIPFKHKDTYHLGWLSSLAPCFPINPKCIRILSKPQEFYEEIIHNCREARRRITLVSLYLGNGKLEKKIVETLIANDNFKRGQLELNVLLDYHRGSRLNDNSRTLLRPLLLENDTNCRISLYHTPLLRGIVKKVVPNRWNELCGLQHMKLYIFDDTLIISGANLSNDYFTNRQDRYFVINNKNICDFYCGLVRRVQQFSLEMDKNNNVTMNDEWNQLPYEGQKSDFIEKAGNLINNYLTDVKNENNLHKEEGYDTWLFPMVQMGQLGIEQDVMITEKLLSDAPVGTTLNISTGYFNLTNLYMKTIIKKSKATCNILMAHPQANGFLGAKGMAGGIPDAYCLIAQRFDMAVQKFHQNSRIFLMEYLKKGWTYHAKGLWYYPPNSKYPSLTLIGSPNFGERSVKRDLETQLAIVTENKELQEKLQMECKDLYRLGLPIEQRTIPMWVHGMVFFFRNYF